MQLAMTLHTERETENTGFLTKPRKDQRISAVQMSAGI